MDEPMRRGADPVERLSPHGVGCVLVPEQSDPNWEIRVAKALGLTDTDEARRIIHIVLEESPSDTTMSPMGGL